MVVVLSAISVDSVFFLMNAVVVSAVVVVAATVLVVAAVVVPSVGIGRFSKVPGGIL